MAAFSYYPGCSLHGTAKEYDRSLKLVAGKLSVELHEIQDWNCCGATAAHSTNEWLGLALPARNLQLAAKSDRALLAPCAMCYNRMKVTQHELQDTAKRQTVAQMLEITGSLATGPDVLSLFNVFATPEMLASVKNAVVKPLKGLKVACYYGCLLVRPPEIVGAEDFENPMAMDRLMTQLGAEVMPYPFKTECCGASLALSRKDIMLQLTRRLLKMAKTVGANCIVTACPMCHSNLDTRQSQIKSALGDDFAMPIFYVTELMGLALGFSPKELYIDKHLTDALRLCQQIEG